MRRRVLGALVVLVAAAAPPAERLNERNDAAWRDHIGAWPGRRGIYAVFLFAFGHFA
jgi:hypothetical protein